MALLPAATSRRAAGTLARRAAAGRGPSRPRAAAAAARPAARSYAASMETDPRGFVLRSGDAAGDKATRMPRLWLRDNCRCERCVNQDTMQRSFNTFEIPQDVAAREIAQDSRGVHVLWSDSHRSSYPWDWLESAARGHEAFAQLSNGGGRKLWDSSIGEKPPEVCFADAMSTTSQAGMADLTSKIHTHGLCFVVGTPKTAEATKELLERIGPVRHTHYGGFYDFVPDLAKADTAYTNLALAAHTDTTYFTEPAGLQAFHMLSHTAPAGGGGGGGGGLGGLSLLVDGFAAAQQLRDESANDFDVLRSVAIPWHASGNEGVAVAPDRPYPVLEARGERLQRVRWNNDDRGVVPLAADADEWYRAARAWDAILRRRQNEYWFQLEPGRVLIFDNWRILHGRSAFEGLRRICGGYINRDDFVSRWKTSNFASRDVIASNMQLA